MKTASPMLSKEAIEEFKEIWRKQFGEEISDEKAVEEGINLLTLMNAVYRPIKKEWVDEQNVQQKAKNDSL